MKEDYILNINFASSTPSYFACLLKTCTFGHSLICFCFCFFYWKVLNAKTLFLAGNGSFVDTQKLVADLRWFGLELNSSSVIPISTIPSTVLYVWNDGGLSNDSKGVWPLEMLDGGFKWDGGMMRSGPKFECPTNFPTPSPHLPYSYPFIPQTPVCCSPES